MSLAPVEDQTTQTRAGSPPSESHAVRCPDDQPSALLWVEFARAHGLEVEALCGLKWVPTARADGLPVCKTCAALMQQAWDEADS